MYVLYVARFGRTFQGRKLFKIFGAVIFPCGRGQFPVPEGSKIGWLVGWLVGWLIRLL